MNTLKESNVIIAKTHTMAFQVANPVCAMHWVQTDLIATFTESVLAKSMWLETSVTNAVLDTKDIPHAMNVMTHTLVTLIVKVSF